MDRDLQRPYLHDEVELSYPWLPEAKARLNNWIASLVALYAKCITHGDTTTAQKQLKVFQREQVRLFLSLQASFLSCGATRWSGSETPSGDR